MRNGSKSIALTLLALTAACTTEPGPHPGPGADAKMPTVSRISAIATTPAISSRIVLIIAFKS